MMEICVYSISVPALSTIGYGYGFEVGTGDEVYFSEHHRAMRDLGNALQLAEESPVALIEPWQVVCKIPTAPSNWLSLFPQGIEIAYRQTVRPQGLLDFVAILKIHARR